MERKPLSDSDRSLLADIPAFNESRGKTGWQISGVVIADMDLSGIQLEKARVQNVDWTSVLVRDGTIRNTVFENVDFEKAQFINTSFEDVSFVGCSFSYSSFTGVDLSKVTFDDFELDHTTLKDTNIAETKFENGKDLGSVFDSTRLASVSFSAVKLDNTSFSGGEMRDVSFEKSALVKTDFSALRSDSLAFSDTSIDLGVFSEGSGSGFKFSGCSSERGFTFSRIELSDVELDHCRETAFLTINNATVGDLSILGCRELYKTAFLESKLV
jgi:uncharacterized protein YjbI with pentapeptide repeats